MAGSGLIVELPADPFYGGYEAKEFSAAARDLPLGDQPLPTSEVRLSKPLMATLTPDDAEGDLRAFMRDQQAIFDIVHVACGFTPGPNERIETAKLGANLIAGLWDRPMNEYSHCPTPIAWSMQPLLRSGDDGDRTTTVRIGADLKLINVGIDHSRRSHGQICIQARGELTSSPIWAISRTRVYILDGDERFILVVRRERRVPLLAIFVLNAVVSRREGLRRRVYHTHMEVHTDSH
jgi:hypothetical protein